MKRFNYFLLIVFILYPFSSLAGSPPTKEDLDQCRTTLENLVNERDELLSRYNDQCRSGNSSAECLQWHQRINNELNLQINTQNSNCQRMAMYLERRRVDDAKGRVDKQSGKTDMLSMLSKAVGTGLVAMGTAPCPTDKGCDWPTIAKGLAGIAMGMVLGQSSDELDNTSEGFDGFPELCPGGNCSPPPPPPPGGGPPSPTGLGSGLLGVPGGPPLPDITNCEPSCPCPVPAGVTPPPNCQITKDEDGNPRMTYGPDKDRDGFGDEEITAADAKKVNPNDPRIKAAIAAAKAPYADMFATLEEDMAEDAEDAGDGELLADAGGEGFLSGGGTKAGRSPGAKGGSGRRPRKNTDDDVNKAVQGLMAQFMKKKNQKKDGGEESKLFGDSPIGLSRDNIFMMVHRRYQERRGENEFIE